MTRRPLTVRPARAADGPALAALYASFVRDSIVSFETEPPDGDEMVRRLEAHRAHPWLVATDDRDQPAGYAYGTPHRARAGYRWSVETTVYVAEPGRGTGRLLMERLLSECADRGLVSAFAGVALPNDASEALHRGLEFSRIGVFPRVGWKLGRWVDVSWWYRPLLDPPPDQPPPLPPGGSPAP